MNKLIFKNIFVIPRKKSRYQKRSPKSDIAIPPQNKMKVANFTHCISFICCLILGFVEGFND